MQINNNYYCKKAYASIETYAFLLINYGNYIQSYSRNNMYYNLYPIKFLMGNL